MTLRVSGWNIFTDKYLQTDALSPDNPLVLQTRSPKARNVNVTFIEVRGLDAISSLLFKVKKRNKCFKFIRNRKKKH